MTRGNTGMGFGKRLVKDQKRKVDDKKSNDGYEAFDPHNVTTRYSVANTSRSVLEQSNIDDLLATVDLRKEEWEEWNGEAVIIETGAVLLDSNATLADVENTAAKSRELVSIPRRPQWHEGMSIEELTQQESDTFIEWRRGLKQLEKDNNMVMTPYERNLDFWRQLWRCMERSDLLVQVCDARDPDFYFCQDLERYVSELGDSKRLMLLVNKADYLSKEQRQRWAEHFQAKGVDALFFSALNELLKQTTEDPRSNSAGLGVVKEVPSTSSKADAVPSASSKTDADATLTQSDAAIASGTDAEVDAAAIPVPDSSDDELTESKADGAAGGSEAGDSSDDEGAAPHGLLLDGTDDGVLDVSRLLDEFRKRLANRHGADSDASGEAESEGSKRKGVVGFVGYPNVGKSTVINAIVGAKKVGMSRTPGKTKHIQTLELPEWGFTLCDAPGLVFPSVVATQAHLVINNTVPLETLIDRFAPVRLMVQKIGFSEICEHYSCSQYVRAAALASGAYVASSDSGSAKVQECKTISAGQASNDHILDEGHSFLAAFAMSRNHFLNVGVPDENWAARKVLRDYTSGKLLHCEPPPTAAMASASTSEPARGAEEDPGYLAIVEDNIEDFDIPDDILDYEGSMATSVGGTSRMTRKKERFMQKQLLKGVPAEKSLKNPHKTRSNPQTKTLTTF